MRGSISRNLEFGTLGEFGLDSLVSHAPYPTHDVRKAQEGVGISASQWGIRFRHAYMPRLVSAMGCLDMGFEPHNFAFVEGDSRYKVKVKLSKPESLRITLIYINNFTDY